MRLFFALLPDVAASKRLAELAALPEWGTSLSLVPLENFHVTLAFIGDILDSFLPAIHALGAATLASGGAVSFSNCEYWLQPRSLS
jgi:2'-5' RNA ligase